MGEAYRGLTIRIGADAQPLTRALSSIRSASRETSKELGKISRALKQDPGNTNLIGLQIRALGDQSKVAATQVAMLERSVKQTLSSYKGGKSNLANMLKDAEANAVNARRQFNSLDTALEGVYDTIRKYNVAANGMSDKDATSALRKFRAEAKGSRDEVALLEKELRRVWSADKSLIPFDTKNIDEAIAKWKELRIQQQRAQESLKRYNDFAGLKNQIVDLEITQSELKQLRTEAINARNALQQMGNSEGAKEAANKQRLLAASTKEAENSLRSMVRISQSLPNNMQAAAMQTRSFEQVTKLLSQQMKVVHERLQTLDSSSVSRIENEFITTGNAVRVLTDEAAGLEAQIQEVTAKVSALKEHMSMLAPGTREFQRCENEVRDLNSQLSVTEGKLTGVNAKLRDANKAHAFRTAQEELISLNGQMAAHEALLATANKKWGQFGSSLRTAGYSMMATVGALGMTIGMYGIQAATDIDSAYRNMRKTVNGTEEQFEALKQSALEFSQTHFTSADQILEIEAIGGQLGVQVQNLEKFAETASNLDIATNLDTETISQNLGQLSNIMNDMDQDLQSGPGSMEAYGDALVRLGNNNAAQEDKIQNVMMRIASMGTICGMTTPDLLALATATAATGQGAEAAGTALSKTFSGIESAVNGSERALSMLQNSSSLTDEEIESLTEELEKGQVELEAFAEIAGMSADEFKEAWNGDNVMRDAFMPFIEGLKRIDREGGSVDSTLTGLEITSVRQKQTLQGLTQTVDVLGDSLTMSNDAWNGVSDQWGAAGDAAREAQRKSEGFSGQLEMLKNNAKVLASTFLESMTPALSGAVDVLRGLVDVFSSMPDWAKQATVGVAALTALAGPIFVFTGNAMAATSAIKKFATGQKQGWSVTREALSSGGDALLFASTMLDRNGKKMKVQGNIAERFGGRMVNAGAKIETFASKNLKAGGMVSKLGTGIGELGIVASTMPHPLLMAAGGVALFAGIVGGSIAYVESLTEKTRAAEDANKKLADSSENLASTVERSFGALDGDIGSSLTISFEEAFESYQTFAEKVASSKFELADSAEEMSTKILTIKESAGDAATLLGRLEDAGSLTELEYEQLSLSIDRYNQTTGDSIQLIRDEDENIRVLRDGVDLTAQSFLDLAKAQEIAAKAEYYKKAYNTAYDTKNEAAKQKQMQQKAYENAKAARDEFERLYKPGNGASEQEIANYTQQMAKLDDKVNSSREALRGTNEELLESAKAAKAATEMYALLNGEAAATEGTFENLIAFDDDAIGAFDATGRSVSDFKAILERAGVSVDALKGKDLAGIIRNWDGNMPSLINEFERLGLILPGAAEELRELSLITIGDKSYIVSDDGTVQWQEDQLHDLREFSIEGKHYYVSDDGTVHDQAGICIGFDSLAIDDKYYIVTDDGSVYDEQGKCEGFNSFAINDKHYIITDDGSIYGQEGLLQSIQDFEIEGKTYHVTAEGLLSSEGELIEFNKMGIDPKEYLVDDDGTIRVQEEKIDSLKEKIASVPGIKVSASLNTTSFYNSLSGLTETIRKYDGKHIKITAGVVPLGQSATGAFRKMATQKNIALHAAGAFITQGTTYIGSDRRGVQHIAGEAGREFVQHHANGTTSIIPIQNRKYMMPFVSAVADMLPRGGNVNTINIRMSYDASADAKTITRGIAREIKLHGLMRG